uniref:Uncharacterized protein n=1 Tax=Triticum urartu TaxID=4572 RepID=A0A8R7THI6_TRIUA
ALCTPFPTSSGPRLQPLLRDGTSPPGAAGPSTPPALHAPPADIAGGGAEEGLRLLGRGRGRGRRLQTPYPGPGARHLGAASRLWFPYCSDSLMRQSQLKEAFLDSWSTMTQA